MKSIMIFVLVLLFITNISALYFEDENLLDAGHAIRIKNITMNPESLAPGDSGVLNINLENGARLNIEDIRINLDLPSDIKHYNDVDRIKISQLESGESRGVNFRIIASPSIKEGIYEASLIVDYTNFFESDTVDFGEEKQDNFSFGIIIKSEPTLTIGIENTDIYQNNNIGEVSIKLVNNGLADIKFLTVKLEQSDNFEIISNNNKYIGDLDSDDFESVDFRLKVKKKQKEILLPIKISYKDSLNNNYEEMVELHLIMRTAKELGIKTKNTSYYIIGILAVSFLIYYFYNKYKKKKNRKHHHHKQK